MWLGVAVMASSGTPRLSMTVNARVWKPGAGSSFEVKTA